MRLCAEHGAAIVPFGAGTSLEGHIAALRGGVSVDMSRMDAILRLSIDDMDVTVQAGVTRRQLDDKLRPEGVFFSVDPGANATIGGMVATGASGTTTVRYGAMRENVVSLLVVTADGSVVRTRSRARKSSAGYDLTRLFIGSEGTLGLVCEATLRIHPTPEAMAAAVCPFATLDGAVECVVAVLRLGIPIARIELADAAQIDAINRHDEMDHEVAPTLFLEFHGAQNEVEEQAAEVQEIALEHGASQFAWATDEAERRRLWHARHASYDAARATRPGSQGLTTDVCVPRLTPGRVHPRDPGRHRGRSACPPRSSATSATATSTPRSCSTRPTRRRSSGPRPSTSASSAARSRWRAPAPASTASATARPRSSSRSTARTRWR